MRKKRTENKNLLQSLKKMERLHERIMRGVKDFRAEALGLLWADLTEAKRTDSRSKSRGPERGNDNSRPQSCRACCRGDGGAAWPISRSA